MGVAFTVYLQDKDKIQDQFYYCLQVYLSAWVPG